MKKLLYFAVCAVLAFSLFGCTKSGTDNPGQNVQQQEDNDKYLESVKDYFPDDNLYRSYNGYAEAGFEVRFDGVEKNESMTVYKYAGAMNDERGTEEDGNRTFNVTYTISNNTIIESVTNEDPMAESENNVYSKLKDLVVLSGNIEEGGSWEQPVELDGKELTAKTTITEVTEDGFKTVTEVEAEGYKDGTYTEERTYTKGKGLTGFNNTPYGSDKDDMLIFGYAYSIDNEESITGMI